MVPHIGIDATMSHLYCLGPLTEWVYALNYLVPTRMDLGETTLLKMLKTLLMLLKTLEMVLNPLWMMENNINDPLCGHSCSDGVMVP